MGERARKVLSEMAKSRQQQPNPKSLNGIIEQTLLEINQAYPEVRDRVKDTPQWKALLEIEQEINRAALEDDFEGLGKALEAYKQAVLTVEDTGSQGDLFKVPGRKQKEPGSDKSTMPISNKGGGKVDGVKSEI